MHPTNLHSKARVGGHPIHPMLVHFPIALFIAGVVALLGYLAGADLFWYRVSYVAFLAGAVTAVLAAIAGSIDLFTGIPADSPARRTGLKHMALNVLALILFTGTGLLMRQSYGIHVSGSPSELDVPLPLALSLIGAVVLAVSGTLGSKLVHKEHVGQYLDEEITPASARTGHSPLR